MSETESHPSVVLPSGSPQKVAQSAQSPQSAQPRRRNRFSRPTRPPRKKTPAAAIRKATAASALGNATEWYDYGVYAVATAYITQNFFPGEGGMLLTLATFAISFLVRPIGGLVWGPLGDRIGRKGILALTILMMSGATFLIGVLPTFEQVGVLAPVLLIVLRMVQGFSTGGEYGGAATYMSEYAPDRRRGFLGSFLEFGTLGGFALGTAIMLLLELILSPEQMASWGWRLPFLLAAPMGLIGFYLRSKLDDTPVYEEMNGSPDHGTAHDAGPPAGAPTAPAASAGPTTAEGTPESETPAPPSLPALFREHWKPMLVMTGLVISVNVVNYTLLSYMPTYLEQQIGLPAAAGLMVILIGEVAMMALMPWAGGLSDKHGRKPSWFFSLGGLILLAIPMFMLMGMNFGLAILGFAVLGLLYIPQLSTITATFPAMFPTQARFSGFAITYNIATSIFGGTAALVNEWGIGVTGDVQFPAYYMMAACAVGLVCAWFMRETAGASLRGSEVPGSIGSAVVPGSPAETALEEGRQPEQRTMDEEQMLILAAEAREAAATGAGGVAVSDRESSPAAGGR
ncbi:MFS transporter [Citricoccus nitrophenolicus]|uniref:Putative proline/betaine transporter n=1 Tax=Citricoccus muralis TaxID=169134 RepID=A0A3D9LC59_9MICC|nr:MFS transporter [Citricoccus muralis]REE03979.1 MHS family proline/betaine transporter-like MFS transporter [Citricoccus muralis]